MKTLIGRYVHFICPSEHGVVPFQHGSWNPPPTGPRHEREILTRRLVWSGFVIFDHMKQYAHAADELARLYHAGKVIYELDVSDDIATAPGAIAALYAGENNGKKIIYIG